MNLLRSLFGNRRKTVDPDCEVCAVNRRKVGTFERAKAAAARRESALDDLNRTLSMSPAETSDFRQRLQMEVVHDSPWTTVEFVTFAESCEYRYSQSESSLGKLCKHPKHDAYATGMASCSKALCPLPKEWAKKK